MKQKENEESKPKEPEAPSKKKEEFDPEYYEPLASETQTVTNIIGWVIAFILLAFALWLLIISL